MPERLERQRHTDITQIGLTQADLDNRGVAAVGYCPEELLPPYNDENHQIRAQTILDHLHEFANVVTCASPLALYDVDWKICFPETKIIEVVGGLADLCVPLAVEATTRTGAHAFVDSRFTFGMRSSYADFSLGKMVIRNVLSYPQRQCLIIGKEKYIFYKTNTEDTYI